MDKELLESLKKNFGTDVSIVDKEGSINFKCDGCRDMMSHCCCNRGDIIISPYDIYKIQKGLNITSDVAISKYTKVILGADSKIPLLILGEIEISNKERICVFLKKRNIDGNKRRVCSIHGFKPSICELFPLGRINDRGDNNKLYYLLQNANCGLSEDNDIKIRDWTPDIENAEKAFILFYNFLDDLNEEINLTVFMNSKKIPDKEKIQFTRMYMSILYAFNNEEDFFVQFDKNAKGVLGLAKEMVEKTKRLDSKIVVK